jgi:hypothetical protein
MYVCLHVYVYVHVCASVCVLRERGRGWGGGAKRRSERVYKVVVLVCGGSDCGVKAGSVKNGAYGSHGVDTLRKRWQKSRLKW